MSLLHRVCAGLLLSILCTPVQSAEKSMLRIALPQNQGAAVASSASQLRSGVNGALAGFAEISSLDPVLDPLQSLLNDKSDIAIVTSSSLSAFGIQSLKIFDLPYF